MGTGRLGGSQYGDLCSPTFRGTPPGGGSCKDPFSLLLLLFLVHKAKGWCGSQLLLCNWPPQFSGKDVALCRTAAHSRWGGGLFLAAGRALRKGGQPPRFSHAPCTCTDVSLKEAWQVSKGAQRHLSLGRFR